jgi:hypothetical protein
MKSGNRRLRRGGNLDIVFGGIEGCNVGGQAGKDHSFSGLLQEGLRIIDDLFESRSS